MRASPATFPRAPVRASAIGPTSIPTPGPRRSSCSRSSDADRHAGACWTPQRCAQSGLHGVAVFAGHILGSQGPGSLHAGSRGRGGTSGWNLRHGGRITGQILPWRALEYSFLHIFISSPETQFKWHRLSQMPGVPGLRLPVWAGALRFAPPLPSLVLMVSQSSEV